jgi:phage baseplate assembly protein W
MRVGISVNLPEGATYDLFFVNTPSGYPEGKISFDISDTPRKITGIQKVAQQYLKVLLTTKGSDVIYPQLGTNFPNLVINSNRYQTGEEFYADIIDSIREAESQAIAILNTQGSDPASNLDHVTVEAIDLADKDGVNMYLSVTTSAGVTASIAIPFPQLDMPLTPER